MHVRQGEEPQELLTALASTPLTSRLGSSDGTLSARQAAVRASPRPCKAVECDAWTQDYQVGCGCQPAIAWGCLPSMDMWAAQYLFLHGTASMHPCACSQWSPMSVHDQ